MKIGPLILLLTAIYCRINAQETLPVFILANADGSYIRNTALPANKSVILIYFQPDCEDCRALTTLLIRDDVIIRRHKVIMITNSDLGKMRQFVAAFKLNERKNIIVGTEGWTGTVQRKLNITRFPTVLGYGPGKILQWQLTNESNIGKLFDHLKQLTSHNDNE